MLREIDRLRQLGLPPVFADLRFEGGFGRSRKPYPRAFVQDVILAPGRLMSLNDEARRVVFLIAGSGLRLTECVNLNKRTIRLADDIPHVQVRPDGRRMKTDESERDVPLTGVALAAMRAQPEGFPRYHDKAASLSATVNAYLSDHKLRPEEGQSLYSLRHTFKDSLKEVEAPDSMIDCLMGHAEDGEKYGIGPSMALKLKWMEKVAFKEPAQV
jgi:integrase